jgi:hypothetical protein
MRRDPAIYLKHFIAHCKLPLQPHGSDPGFGAGGAAAFAAGGLVPELVTLTSFGPEGARL